MDFGRKKTQKYTFKSPKLEDLRTLGSLVVDTKAFSKRYGHFLSLLRINMEDGVLSTLIQFYDPVYHCFTFPEYQLMPTLEEYSHLLSVPISSQDPFFDLEEDPKDQDIAKAPHLKMSEIRDHMTTKGKMLGLIAKFLMNKAQYFARMRSVDTFKAIFALLIYGLFVFPSFDDFVAMDSIKIFLIGNLVPTLLVDAYHSVHMRNSYSRVMITCCMLMLYKWFISHLPRSHAFWDLKDGLLWSQKIMSLTHSDIVWYSRDYDGVNIIDSCGGFSNVPLLEKVKIALTKAQRERDAWKNKYQIINNEDEEIKRQWNMKNEEDLSNKKKKVQEDIFSYGVQSGAPWKLIMDKLVLEKAKVEE
ncbi:uncharacterized protein LOC127082285 [Lathyrus oleraceus]|uniref:uncharacterized protein LOC127082285 n=1 Tax=Pisum sativum TaxID=3888 RepID=UPI0021CE1AE8|nr:uncharacterized protein LOC127082285 [Pisum sativum]